MTKKILIFVFSLFILFSCESYKTMLNSDSNIKKVSIGMYKAEVIKIMGEGYEIIGASEESETLCYKSLDDGIYRMEFKDGKLIKWDKEWLIDRYPSNYRTNSSTTFNQKKENSGLKSHLDAHRNAMLSSASSDEEKAHVNTHMDAHTKAMTGE